MENGGVFRHRRTPSSDRFLGVFSQSPPALSGSDAFSVGGELDEDEIFWTGDFAESNRRPDSPSAAVSVREDRRRRVGFPAEKFGILAALPEDGRSGVGGARGRSVLYRASSVSPSPSSSLSISLSSSSSASSSSRMMIPPIPKPPHERESSEFTQSVPARKFLHSAPMNVPVLSKAMEASRRRSSVLVEVDGEDEEEDEMLPPHEIVARGSNRSPKTTCSVLEGVGRTLKGRDLRQVRNAVWRRTGFLD